MRRRKGRGSPPIPRPSPFTAAGLRPDRSSRSGRGRRPPRRRLPAFGAGSPFTPLRGRMGRLCVQAKPPDLARRKAGGRTGAARPRSGGPADPHAGRGGRIGYSAARVARGPCPARPGQHPAGGARGGPRLPVELGGCKRGGACSTPLRVPRHECCQYPSTGGCAGSRTSSSSWTTPSGSPRSSRTCEPVSPAATASGLRNVLLSNLVRRKMATTGHGFWELMRIARGHAGGRRVRPTVGRRRRGFSFPRHAVAGSAGRTYIPHTAIVRPATFSLRRKTFSSHVLPSERSKTTRWLSRAAQRSA